MSELFDLITSRLDPDMLGAIAGRLGLGEDEARTATAVGLPALLGGMTQHAQSDEGARGLIDDVEATGGGASLDGLLDRLRGGETDADAAAERKFGGMMGGGILDALIGRLGIGGPVVRKLVGMLGPLVIGALGKLAGSERLSPSRLASLLGDATGSAADAAPGGRAGLASLLGPIAGLLGIGTAGASVASAHEGVGNVVDTVAEREAAAAPAATGLSGTPQDPRRRRGALGWLLALVAVAAIAAIALAVRGCGDDDDTPTGTGTTVATTTTGGTGAAGGFSAAFADDKVTLTGNVPTEEARTAAVDAATATYGDGNVTDQLTVDGDAVAGPSGDVVAKVLAALKGAGSGWSAAFDGPDALTLTGEVASDDIKAAILTAAKTAFAPGTVTDQMTVAAGGGDTADDTVDAINKEIQLRGVTFVTGSANLTPASRTTLDKVASLLTQAEAVKAEVQGHTDNQGNAAANLALSNARARAVVAYLVGKGIAAGRLTAKGYGQTTPVATNATEAGRAKNRRVVFVPTS